jgi:N-acetylmuramoyl-L-alanine amidase
MPDITQKFLTKNDCYKAGRKITPKGIMVHSTGANNPKLSRYIQPDDGILGKNPNQNDWNMGGIDRCVHGFIGKDKNGKARIYQTLPWNHRGWHGGGKSNDTHIGFEICEDGLTDPIYFNEVYNLAVELCAFLCKEFNLTVDTVIGHYEGYQKGIATNHGDPKHWFSRHGKSMDTLREDIKKKLTPVVPSVIYEAHVQNIGWQGKKRNGETAGTTGKFLRLEALTVKLENTNARLELEGHVENKGWTALRTNGEVIGTIGEGLRLEAVKLKCATHPLLYRVHVEGTGWMPWVKNGEVAGTVGRSLRIEAIEIKIA